MSPLPPPPLPPPLPKPPSLPPVWRMHLPSAIRGEQDVLNIGVPFVSLRQASLPVMASWHDTTPQTPNVHTFPSATAGVLRGPLCPWGTPGFVAGNFSDHTSLPLS